MIYVSFDLSSEHPCAPRATLMLGKHRGLGSKDYQREWHLNSHRHGSGSNAGKIAKDAKDAKNAKFATQGVGILR